MTRRFINIIPLKCWTAALTLISCAASPPAHAQDAQSFLTSVDYCADQYLLALAQPQNIKALSNDATSVFSFYKNKAVGIPQMTGSAEEVLFLNPTYSLRNWRGNPTIDKLFARAGTTSLPIGFAPDPDGTYSQIIALSEQLGVTEKGKAFIMDRKQRLSHLKTLKNTPLKALYVTVGGFTAGTDTFVDDIIKSAGFQSKAGDYNIKYWAPVPVEKVVQSPPDVIIGSFFDLPTPSSHWSLTRHPYVSNMFKNLPTIMVPSSYLSCNGLFFVDSAEFIRSEAASLGLVESFDLTKTAPPRK